LIDLGRRYFLRQNLISKIHEHDNTNLYKQFKDLIGEIYTAEVHHVRPRVVILVDDEGNEIILPENKYHLIFRKGDNIRGIIESVELKGNKPQIIMSRTSETF
jgi:N utilization substance protein A